MRKLSLSLLILLLMCPPVSAMSGFGHAQLWNNLFGISPASQSNISPLWRTAQEVIDGWQEDYRKITEKFTWFKWGSYGHRLLFHWGFNTDPRRYPQLVRQVRLCLKDNPNAEAEERKFFAYLTKDIQSHRNRKLIGAVVSVTGIPTARGYANAIATILYDVHLLGDYSTTNTSALPAIGDIEKDIMFNGLVKLVAGEEKSERLNAIGADLTASILVGRGRTNSKRAELLIETVKKYLPQILNERFKNTLSEHGITITVPK